jgi:hypothetical protein
MFTLYVHADQLYETPTNRRVGTSNNNSKLCHAKVIFYQNAWPANYLCLISALQQCDAALATCLERNSLRIRIAFPSPSPRCINLELTQSYQFQAILELVACY